MTTEQKTMLIESISNGIKKSPNFDKIIKTNVDFLFTETMEFIKSENPKLVKHVEGLIESFLSSDQAKMKQSLVWGFVDFLEMIVTPKPEPVEPVTPSK